MSVSIHFFVDLTVIQQLSDKHIDAAKGHLIILGHHDRDNNLKIAALLDGSSIDFLFGVNNATQGSISRIKVNNVKKFMKSLDVAHQEKVAKFYGEVYQSIVDYYNWKANSWNCCCDTKRAIMIETIENSFQDLRDSLGDRFRL